MQTTLSPPRNETAEQAEVRSVIDALFEAVRAINVEAWLAQCAQGITTYDMIAPLKHEGADEIRRVWATTIESFDQMGYEPVDQEIAVSGDVAWSRNVNRVETPGEDGTMEPSYLCETLCLRRIDGVWKLVHSHVSVPFDMETGMALLDLQPQ